MILKTNLRLVNLHCITPTDPNGEDEPYLWVFFITVDGSNIRQRTNDPAHLSATVSVISGPGGPGNLGSATVHSSGNIHIPPNVGESSSNLKPIVLTFAQAGTTFRVFIPGQMGVFCFAIDEDSTPRKVMEGAFDDVKKLIETGFNDFLNSLDLNSMATNAFATESPVTTFQLAFVQQLTQFTDQIRQQAIALVTQNVIAAIASNNNIWNFFENLAQLADADEPIGFARFLFSEQEILNRNFADSFHADLRQSHNNLGGAWYVVHGSLDASALFASTDIKSQTLPEVTRQIGNPEEYIFRKDHIAACVYTGNSVQISRFGNSEKYQISVEYPFANYRYTLDGQALNGNSGTIMLQKEVRIPEFDEDSLMPGSPFVRYRKETRPVTVQFAKNKPANDPQIEQLFLSNDPTDGNYDLLLDIEAVLENGRIIHVGSEPIYFDGQTIKLPDDFSKHVRDCLENFVGTKWSKSKRVGLKELWGPAARRQRYEDVVKELDALVTVGAFDRQSVDTAKNIVATVLKVKQQ